MSPPLPDFDQCYRAVSSRDGRFDGWFFTAVTSTGIYCRPSCPALTPKRANVRFYPSPAAAQLAGFRACMRCRPDATPGSPEWDIRADAVGRAMRLIADGVVDRIGVAGLAQQLGYTERHLGRMLIAEVGASPIALARAQRAQTARILIETTDLGFAEIAFAAGFGSVRQFNDTVRAIYAMPPSRIRQNAVRQGSQPQQGATGSAGVTITLRLAYRPPLAAEALTSFLAVRALPGVEAVSPRTAELGVTARPADPSAERMDLDGPHGAYRRTLRLPHGPGTMALSPLDSHVAARLRLTDLRDLAPAVRRCRRLFDLDADPSAIDELLGDDDALAADVAQVPGVRTPRSVDGFEMACRAIVGQQISVASARRVLTKLAGVLGETVAQPADEQHALLRLFPSPEAVADAPDSALRMPRARRRTLRTLAQAVASGDLDLDGASDWEDTRKALLALPGIGPWTAEYVAMRGLGDPDTFLPTDLVVRRSAARLGLSDSPADLLERSRRWRPWRAYAVIRLWRQATVTDPISGG